MFSHTSRHEHGSIPSMVAACQRLDIDIPTRRHHLLIDWPTAANEQRITQPNDPIQGCPQLMAHSRHEPLLLLNQVGQLLNDLQVYSVLS